MVSIISAYRFVWVESVAVTHFTPARSYVVERFAAMCNRLVAIQLSEPCTVYAHLFVDSLKVLLVVCAFHLLKFSSV